MADTVIHNIGTGGPGGAESVLATLAAAMQRQHYRSVPVVPYEGWLSGRLLEQGLQARLAPAKGGFNLRYVRTLIDIARRERARLIHSHLLGASVYGCAAARWLGLPAISLFHGATDLLHPGSLDSAKRWLIAGPRCAVVAVSKGVQDALAAWGVPRGAIRVIYNGIDTERYVPAAASPLRAQFGVPDDMIHVGSIGNLRVAKAYDVLLRAAAIVIAQNPRVRFSIVGEGDEQARSALDRLHAELGLGDAVVFRGFVPAGPDVFRCFDLLVSSSRTEGLPLSLVEGMACAKIVVATRSGGSDEVIDDGVDGLLVPNGDHAALAAAILRAVGDASLRATLGAQARRRAESQFCLGGMLRQYSALYAELIDGRARRVDA